jgi:hypothetical protein
LDILNLIMGRPPRLRKHHLLPEKAAEVARLVKDNQPLEKDEFDDLVEQESSLEEADIEKHIRLLRMSNNLVIEDGKARIDPVRCGESGPHVMEKFRRWKRKAQKT